MNGKNVKIITVDGAVTLRGPVRGEKRKPISALKAQQIAGVRTVDNHQQIKYKKENTMSKSVFVCIILKAKPKR